MAKMKTPKKKEVVRCFENAKEVACLCNGKSYDISENITRDFYEWNNGFWIDTHIDIKVWDETHGYAKILSYKEPKEKTYKITREQVKQLKHNAFHENNQLVVADLKNWFPEVFETKLPNCFTGWVLDEKYPKVIAYSENGFLKYGFDANGNWIEGTNTKLLNEREASEQEVTEALTKEAVRRGFKNGNYNCLFLPNLTHKVVENFHYRKEDDTLYQGENPDSKNNAVYSKGQWAEIIPTLTIQEAEAKLNCKII